MQEKATPATCTAFAGHTKIAGGTLQEVARQVKVFLDAERDATVLIFEDETAQPVEIDFRGTVPEVLARLAAAPASDAEKRSGPGRPKLGVESHEVSLLPRHWEWLSSQPGGASGTLRRLVDRARKESGAADRARQAQEAAHRFMWAMAGNLPDFEEASRAFFAKGYSKMKRIMRPWPEHVRDHLWRMVERVAEREKEAQAG